MQVTDCAGYNDQGVEVSGGVINVTPATSFYAYTHGYYGPATFYVASNAAILGINVGLHPTPLKSGTFVLGAGVSGAIVGTFATVPITMIGQ